jgi:hypothetical protein
LLLLTFGFVESSDIGWHSPVAAVCVAGGIVVLAVFVAWERRAAAPMVPPALLRTRGFGWACAVYLLAYLAFSGFIYYVTLFFQNIEQWSALRTGLSWLFFCIPYFVVAQLGKRLARWLPVARAVGSGCFIAAAGVLVCGHGRSSPGIIRDRLGPVQLLSPDRHGNGAGDLGIRRRRCDLGRMASACRIFPRRPNGSRPHSSLLMSRAARLTWSPRPPGRTCSTRRLHHSLAASRPPCSWPV